MITPIDEGGLGSVGRSNFAAKKIFDAWLTPLADLGMWRNVIEGIGSTDHVPFVEAGMPAFTTIKDFGNYDVRARHTNADFADAVKIEDVRQSAVVLAVFAWARGDVGPADSTLISDLWAEQRTSRPGHPTRRGFGVCGPKR